MKLTKAIIAISVSGLFSIAAFAQTTSASEVQRNVNQEQRIEQGLQSGQLTTREAGKLEKQEAKVDKMEANAMKDGNLSPQERARIQRQQNKVSQEIYNKKHNAATGNPNSPSSQLMQANVQRNINQQSRIEQGVKSGELTGRETAKLERGQARVDRKEARAAADGHVSPAEEANIQTRENNQSRRIYNKKHNPQVN